MSASSGRPIHLLVFGLRWPPDTFLRAKLERLAQIGYRVTVACPRHPHDRGIRIEGVSAEPIIPSGPRRPSAILRALSRLGALLVRRPAQLVPVVRAARQPTADGRLPGRLEALERVALYARLAALRPDVVQFEWITAAVHFASLPEALGCPSVVSCRGSDVEIYPHTPTTQQVASGFPLALARASAIHCVSDAIARDAIGLGADAAKIAVIKPAVDSTVFRPPDRASRTGDVLRIVSVGWLHWRKGHEDALVALVDLVRAGQEAHLDLVGREPTPEMSQPGDSARIRHAIADLGLDGRVQVHGHLEQRRVRALLEGSDVLLHASRGEGIPNVVLEAMACAVPVVVTDAGGTSELVRDGVDGFVCPPRDPGALASALLTLARDPELRTRMGASGRARVESGWTLERQAELWAELYERVVRSARPGTATRPLRLLEVGLRWPPEPFLQAKLQGLGAVGFEPFIASIVEPGAGPRPLAGIRLERLPHWGERRAVAWFRLAGDSVALLLRDPPRLRRVIRASVAVPRSRRRLFFRLARLRADVFHIEWLSFAGLCAPLFDVWRRPVVLSCHGSEVHVDPHTPGRGRLAPHLPELFGQAAAVHCVSQAVLDAARDYGLAAAKARLIRPGVDTEFFRPPSARPSAGSFRVASVGWLGWLKGHEFALLAIRRLADAGVAVRYEIVGGDPPTEGGEVSQRSRICAAIADLGLERAVVLLGWLDRDRVRSCLQEADVLLHASLSEGIPTVVLEAMACGVPVVATDVGGVREAVDDGVTGFVVPPRDPVALAATLSALWSDPALRSRMGAAGRARAESEFGLARNTASFTRLYRELARMEATG
jgi:glycosyltransferase involved in cell wall biosynthesis